MPRDLRQGKRLKPEYHRAAERLAATKSKVLLVQTQPGIPRSGGLKKDGTDEVTDCCG